MNKQKVRTNEEKQIVNEEDRSINEERSKLILDTENKIEELTKEMIVNKRKRKKVRNANIIARFKPICTAILGISSIYIAASNPALGAIARIMIVILPVSILEICTRYTLGTKKERKKEEVKLLCSNLNLQQELTESEERLKEYKNININDDYQMNKQTTIKPINHQYDEEIKTSSLIKKKTK